MQVIYEYDILIDYGFGWEIETTEISWDNCREKLKRYMNEIHYPVTHKKKRIVKP